jgi:two-component system, NarL family, sensor histidine kinase DegS
MTDHSPLPMATTEGATHILRYVNPAFCRMMNRSAKQLVGRPLSQLLPKKDECVKLLDRVFLSGKPASFTEPEHSRSHPAFWSYTIWPVRADERHAGVMIQVTETTAFHGKAVAMNEALMLGSVRQHELAETADNVNAQLRVEIAERKRTGQALRAARAQLAVHARQLERVIARRTAELTATNRRLETSLRMTRKRQDEYRALFLESQVLQKKLRHLTRQIITAQEEERKQISRELHDEVVQTLVGINVELAALGVEASAGGRTIKAKLVHAQRSVEDSVRAVHRFARGLRPAVLDDLGLIPALHAHCKNLAEQTKIRINLTAFAGVETLGIDDRTVLFRVAQEALTNVVRHAQATGVRLGITRTTDGIRMEIADNGKSFAVEKTMRKGNNKRLGLVGMRERVEMVGGTLNIESNHGTGTTVRADVPFRAGKIKPVTRIHSKRTRG